MRVHQDKEKQKSAAGGNNQSQEANGKKQKSFMPPATWNGVKMPTLGGSAMPPQFKKKPEEEPAQKKAAGPVAQKQDRLEKTYTHDPEAEKSLQAIAPQQMLYELAAHDVAYGQTFDNVSDETLAALSANGYQANAAGMSFHKGTLGFRAVIIRPEPGSGKLPILAIRGTNPGKTREDFETIFTDLDEAAVGTQQFQQNKELIEALIAEAGGKVDVTGHSLGGAMAQHTAVSFSGMVGHCATFQSPGIDQGSVDKFNAMPEDQRPTATHHIVTGDLVDKAGDANIAGDVYEHDFGLFLNVNQLLVDVKEHISNVNTSAQMLLDIDVMDPRQNVRDYELLKATFGNLKAFMAKTGGDVGEAHGTRVFSGENYADIRASNGVSDAAFAKGEAASGSKAGEMANIGKFDGHPHPVERATAEGIRAYLGPKLQVMFKLVWKALDAYEAVKDGIGRGGRYVKEKWDGTKETISYYANRIMRRLW